MDPISNLKPSSLKLQLCNYGVVLTDMFPLTRSTERIVFHWLPGDIVLVGVVSMVTHAIASFLGVHSHGVTIMGNHLYLSWEACSSGNLWIYWRYGGDIAVSVVYESVWRVRQ